MAKRHRLKFALVYANYNFIYNDVSYRVYQFTNISMQRGEEKKKFSVDIFQVYPKPYTMTFHTYSDEVFTIADCIGVIDARAATAYLQTKNKKDETRSKFRRGAVKGT